MAQRKIQKMAKWPAVTWIPKKMVWKRWNLFEYGHVWYLCQISGAVDILKFEDFRPAHLGWFSDHFNDPRSFIYMYSYPIRSSLETVCGGTLLNKIQWIQSYPRHMTGHLRAIWLPCYWKQWSFLVGFKLQAVAHWLVFQKEYSHSLLICSIPGIQAFEMYYFKIVGSHYVFAK